ncbi:MAG: universal stress protein [Pseudomonadota bacterium]
MKAFKEILLYVYDVEDMHHMKPALEFTQASEGHILGMYAIEPVKSGFAISETRSALLETHWKEQKARASAAETQFGEMCQSCNGLQADWICLEGEPADLLMDQARYVDVLILRHGAADQAVTARMNFVEKAILAPGGPVILLPDNSTAKLTQGNKVVIAWDESREAARSVKDSMPLLATADSVDILTLYPPDEMDGQKGERLCQYLSKHGINAQAHILNGDSQKVGSILLDWVEQNNADLLIMGAYGHSRLREIVLGGSTNHILKNARVPVFMSH